MGKDNLNNLLTFVDGSDPRNLADHDISPAAQAIVKIEELEKTGDPINLKVANQLRKELEKVAKG